MRKNAIAVVGVLALAAGTFLVGGRQTMAARDAGGESREIFNGKDLTGWEGDSKFWSVEDGCIVGRTTKETPAPHNTFLFYRGGDVKDFELHIKFKLRNHNSGVQYRSKELPDYVAMGYQADIAEGSPSKYTGILYEEKGRGIVAQRGEKVVIDEEGKKTVTPLGDPKAISDEIHMDDWNDYVITAKGNHITQVINGVTTVDVTDNQTGKAASEGVLALQIHQGPPMEVRFKDIHLRELK